MLHALALSLLLWQGLSVRLKGTPDQAAVAAVVPVHRPHFRFLNAFLQDWRGCEPGRRAMDIFVVFSSKSDAHEFGNVYRRTCKDDGEPCDPLPYQELIVTPSHVPVTAYKAWKKIDGLAQIVELPGQRYDFGVMMDAEIGLESCAGFSRLHEMLVMKHRSKTWYGYSRHETPHPDVSRIMSGAACALSLPSVPSDFARSEGFEGIKCEPSILESIRPKLKNFTVYTWWNDLPYVHLPTARRMFDSWAAALQRTAQPPSPTAPLRHAVRAWASAMLPTPTQVSSSMGSAPHSAGEVSMAARAFEHIVYQMYTVMYEGFSVVDLSDALVAGTPSISLGEGFCFHSFVPADRATYARIVQPLWQRSGCPPYEMPYGLPLIRFHLNRR